MLAKQKKFNVFLNYHLIVIFMKYGAVDDDVQVLFIAFSEKNIAFA